MEEDRVPLLFVDVNIEDGKTARIIVYEGEKSEDLANKFAQEHSKIFYKNVDFILIMSVFPKIWTLL